MNRRHFNRLKFTSSILLALLLAACQPAKIHHERVYSFGTLIEISYITEQAALANQASVMLSEELQRMHHSWHAWEESDLTRLNQQLQQPDWISPDQDLLSMIAAAKTYHQLSQGAFDPGIGALVAYWGFHQDQPDELKRANQAIPPSASIGDIEIVEHQIRSLRPGIHLDLGGLAKGYGLGQIAQQLLALGVDHFVINAGGDLVVHGQRFDRPWQIGVRGPQPNQILAAIDTLNSESIFSSGNYERQYQQQGQSVHHIINPDTGLPAVGIDAVTVIHPNAMLADAAATALLVSGKADWRKIAKNMGISMALVYDNQGKLEMTDAMRARVELPDSLKSNLVTDKM